MTHDLVDQDVEELVEEIWTLDEEGRQLRSELQRRSQVRDFDATLLTLAERGLASTASGTVALTPEGRALAERQVRRHRLAEVLFTTVLEVADDTAVNRTACVIEHVLDSALTDSICAFLGHPRVCPHGKTIPSGSCCGSVARPLQPLVQPLTALGLGQDARIVYMVPHDPALLVKLSNLGVAPGAVVHLQQRSPAAVLRIGETTLALDTAIAAGIYVKRVA